MAQAEYQRCTDKFFVNPYTFVDIDRNTKKVADAEEFYQKEELHTGYLECKLVTRTPLGIPDDERKQVDDEKHASYPFFSACGAHPLIPGSSLRGVVRSVYETVSDSCLSTMQENTGLSFRVGVTDAYDPGLLIREKEADGEAQWRLYKAKKYLIPCKGRGYKSLEGVPCFRVENADGKRVIRYKGKTYRHGDPVSFKTADVEPHRKNGSQIWAGVVESIQPGTTGEAYIYIGENFSKKHGEGIFKKGERCAVSERQIEDALSLLKKSLDIYRNEAVNKEYPKGHTGYAGFEHAVKAGVLPVWVSPEGHPLRFSMAAVGRSFVGKSLNELVDKKAPCRKRKALCEACRLFGMAGRESLGSRVRFSDAEAVRISKIHHSVTLKELGQPRYSYLPFHAKGRAVKSYDDGNVQIRGRKFYWHNLAINENLGICSTEEKTSRNATLDLVGTGSEFLFRVYYDGISRKQLEQLEWALTLGENTEESRLCHKIGHGKPLGLGSCKIVALSAVERSTEDGGELVYRISRETDRDKLAGKIDKEWETGLSCRELLKVCDMDAVKGEDITYPYIVADVPEDQRRGNNVYANHQWFTSNKGRRKGDPSAQMLPDIMAEDQQLKLYEIVKNTQGNSYKYNGKDRKYGQKKNYDSRGKRY